MWIEIRLEDWSCGLKSRWRRYLTMSSNMGCLFETTFHFNFIFIAPKVWYYMRGVGSVFYSSQMILRLSPLTPVRKLAPPCFARMYYKHKEDPLYVPFATDAERELASIRFWVSKNTNLKGVNVNCRVGASEAKLTSSMLIFHSGVFLLIAISTSMEGAQSPHILIKIQ